MAQSGIIVRAKITSKIFNVTVASTINIFAKNNNSVGEYGGFGGTSKEYSAVPVVVLGVPYSTITGDRQYNSMGFNAEGSSKIALPYDTVINQGDKVQIEVSGVVGEVLTINDYPYGNVSLAKIITIKQLIGKQS